MLNILDDWDGDCGTDGIGGSGGNAGGGMLLKSSCGEGKNPGVMKPAGSGVKPVLTTATVGTWADEHVASITSCCTIPPMGCRSRIRTVLWAGQAYGPCKLHGQSQNTF